MGFGPHRAVRRAALWSAVALAIVPRCASAADPPPSPAPGVLFVEVAGIPAPGTLYLEIYDAHRQDRWGDPLRRERLPVAAKAAEWRVDGLPHGEYAVRVFLDQNGNGDLDHAKSGIPSEPFGFSNDARRRFGVPKLRGAAFRFAAPEQRVAIQLRGKGIDAAPAPPGPAAAAPEPQR